MAVVAVAVQGAGILLALVTALRWTDKPKGSGGRGLSFPYGGRLANEVLSVFDASISSLLASFHASASWTSFASQTPTRKYLCSHTRALTYTCTSRGQARLRAHV